MLSAYAPATYFSLNVFLVVSAAVGGGGFLGEGILRRLGKWLGVVTFAPDAQVSSM